MRSPFPSPAFFSSPRSSGPWCFHWARFFKELGFPPPEDRSLSNPLRDTPPYFFGRVPALVARSPKNIARVIPLPKFFPSPGPNQGNPFKVLSGAT